MEAWIRALGVDGARTAASCAHWGLPSSSLDIVVDRLHVRRRLRAGKTVTAVLALAAQYGVDLHLTP
ncbi:hypothetical protein OIE69_44580 (plasmid) [Actinacidiphila glaucinigra]|uniref:hypothetical protein n=1 Tax=Actinacidiphila glaucinigra TaxID=235986 RepID=UPI002DD8B2C8|nr:hypothetical protein [Actinacidiphila glaucinigra]WSD66001.1 hypothetical protein OIE69_43270 [Actinacidiphila glaucinigra]WSD66002.1 hypothetical protein OIE69_44580 [Actinacidiphila glaucinigra]